MSTRSEYPTNLTDPQWHLLDLLLPLGRWQWGGPGRPPTDRRRVVNGLLYLTKTGCQWRLLPLEFGPWQTVYGYFKRWRQSGVWARVMDQLNRQERQRHGRHPTPSAGSIDSQSVKTATQSETKGYDGGKKINGRKRHALVDTLGLVLGVRVTAADVGDRAGLKQVLTAYFSTGVKRLRKLWVDGGYSGDDLKDWVAGLKRTHKIDLEVVGRTGSGFTLVPRRWVAERTFAWLLNYRRHSKDYERRTCNSEALIQIAMSHLLLKRLA